MRNHQEEGPTPSARAWSGISASGTPGPLRRLRALCRCASEVHAGSTRPITFKTRLGVTGHAAEEAWLSIPVLMAASMP